MGLPVVSEQQHTRCWGVTPATGLQWYSFSYSSWWSDLIWYLLNDAWGEQPVGTLPHAVYALICPPLGDQAGLTRGEETDDAFCRRCLKAIAGV